MNDFNCETCGCSISKCDCYECQSCGNMHIFSDTTIKLMLGEYADMNCAMTTADYRK